MRKAEGGCQKFSYERGEGKGEEKVEKHIHTIGTLMSSHEKERKTKDPKISQISIQLPLPLTPPLSTEEEGETPM